jgi:hypothetical protein
MKKTGPACAKTGLPHCQNVLYLPFNINMLQNERAGIPIAALYWENKGQSTIISGLILSISKLVKVSVSDKLEQ